MITLVLTNEELGQLNAILERVEEYPASVTTQERKDAARLRHVVRIFEIDKADAQAARSAR